MLRQIDIFEIVNAFKRKSSRNTLKSQTALPQEFTVPPHIADDDLARKLWALGDPVRLRIVRLLPDSPSAAFTPNVSELADRLGLSQPTISHHLRVLRQASLIEGEKRCRDMVYWIKGDHAHEILDHLTSILFEPVNPAP